MDPSANPASVPSPIPRHRVAVIAAVVACAMVAAMVVAPPARAASDVAAGFVAAINAERAATGLPALAVADDLVAVARAHSGRMADTDLHHNPDLATDVSGWQLVGENVGRGPSVTSIHAAFMRSPSHRANVLEPAWTEVGVGVEVRDGRIWVTEVFRQPAARAARPVARDGRALVMLARVAGDDAAMDATAA